MRVHHFNTYYDAVSNLSKHKPIANVYINVVYVQRSVCAKVATHKHFGTQLYIEC